LKSTIHEIAEQTMNVAVQSHPAKLNFDHASFE